MVTQLRTEPGSTGCQTCTLTATPKSQAQWHGSQSPYSSVVALTLPCPFGQTPSCSSHPGIPCASTNRPSPIQSTPHKCFTHLWGPSNRGQPTWGSFIQFYRHASDDLTASHPISDTICCEGRA